MKQQCGFEPAIAAESSWLSCKLGEPVARLWGPRLASSQAIAGYQCLAFAAIVTVLGRDSRVVAAIWALTLRKSVVAGVRSVAIAWPGQEY